MDLQFLLEQLKLVLQLVVLDQHLFGLLTLVIQLLRQLLILQNCQPHLRVELLLLHRHHLLPDVRDLKKHLLLQLVLRNYELLVLILDDDLIKIATSYSS